MVDTKKLECGLAIIGGGPGGYECALKAAQMGISDIVCIDKRARLGGTCLNVGCIPSKALLESSLLYYKAKNGMREHGVECDNVSFNIANMMKQKSDAMNTLGGGIDMLMKKNKVTKITGFASFASPNSLKIRTDTDELLLTAKNIVIATGSEVAMLPGITADGKVVVTSTEALEFTAPPKHLLIIGAGVIGVELASVWSRLGSKVTIVEYLPRIVPACDKEVGVKLQGYLEKQGIKFVLGTQVSGIKVKGDVATVEVKNVSDGSAASIEADKVIVAIGRKPEVAGLGLEAAGVKVDDRGRVITDSQFRTNVPNIFAVGDVIAGPMLAHKAGEDGVAVAEILSGRHGHVDYNTIPSVVYTTPEAAMVGKTEEQLKESGVEYKVGKFSFAANSRAVATLHKDGFVKVIVDAKTDEILGVHIIHEIAGELIMPGVIGMNYRASSEDIAMSCFPHPGFGEALKEACLAAYFKALHA